MVEHTTHYLEAMDFNPPGLISFFLYPYFRLSSVLKQGLCRGATLLIFFKRMLVVHLIAKRLQLLRYGAKTKLSGAILLLQRAVGSSNLVFGLGLFTLGLFVTAIVNPFENACRDPNPTLSTYL